MIVIWLLIVIITLTQIVSIKSNPRTFAHDWRLIESLMEEQPFVVALLSSTKDYMCTGSIISKKSILTSGSCVSYEPKYVVINSALYYKKINNSTVLEVSYTMLHTDFIFDLTGDPNVTRMHSNIGLVYVNRPVLDVFVNAADLGNYYASELKDKKLIAIGYGRTGRSDMVALQHQAYHQTPCTNPKWYYCICGVEYSSYIQTYTHEFGLGGPVMYGKEVVGVAATPCGTLSIKHVGIKYNVFTVVGPYLPWIFKTQTTSAEMWMRATTRNDASSQRNQLTFVLLNILVTITISKVLL